MPDARVFLRLAGDRLGAGLAFFPAVGAFFFRLSAIGFSSTAEAILTQGNWSLLPTTLELFFGVDPEKPCQGKRSADRTGQTRD
jgi:hypothetical protein